jgi:hypothetical protein
MLKRMILSAVTTAFVAGMALPVQLMPAEAGMGGMMNCRQAAKERFPGDRKARHAFKKECKAAHKGQKA